MRCIVVNAFAVLVCLLGGSGCDHSYVVANESLLAARASMARANVVCVIPATRGDGAGVLIRSDSIIAAEAATDTGQLRVTARRGRAKAAVGVFLSAIGAALFAPGAALLGLEAASMTPDDSGGVIAVAFPLLAVGSGHLIPGIILTAIGATDSPQSRRRDDVRCADPTAAVDRSRDSSRAGGEGGRGVGDWR